MKSHSGKTLQKKNGYRIIDCKSCNFIHIVPLPSKQKLKKLYQTNYYKKLQK